MNVNNIFYIAFQIVYQFLYLKRIFENFLKYSFFFPSIFFF